MDSRKRPEPLQGCAKGTSYANSISELSSCSKAHLVLMYNSSTLVLAHGVFLKNFRLDLMLGS